MSFRPSAEQAKKLDLLKTRCGCSRQTLISLAVNHLLDQVDASGSLPVPKAAAA